MGFSKTMGSRIIRYLMVILLPVSFVTQAQLPNSSADELAPVFSPSGDTLYFVRDYHDQRKQDSWFSIRSPQGYWQDPQVFPLNTNADDVIVAQRGSQLYLANQYFRKKVRPGLSVTTRQGNTWASPESVTIPALNSSSGHIGFHLVHDSLLLLAMPDSRRLDDDLFFTRKNTFGEWREPTALGKKINSSSHDFAPFWLDPYLYFSSDRSGNADVYRSKRLDNSWENWSEPEPLTSINTAGFEAYFSVHPKDSTVYYVQASVDSVHSDLMVTSLGKLFRKTNSIDSITSTAPLTTTNQPVILRRSTLFFDYRSFDLSTESQEVLQRLLQHMSQEKPSRIRIIGYADAVGESEPNLLLSQKRAARVKLFLMQEGKVNVPIELESLGSSQAQVNPNRPEADRQKDRRVEILLIE